MHVKSSEIFFFIIFLKMYKKILFHIFLLITLVKAGNEPLLDILNYYQQTLNISDTCSRHLGILKNGLESHQIWAIKGDT